jgi:5-methylcytosine-specific restriction endonuclease McrA
MAVFVLDKRKRPLMPCPEKRARLLLDRGRAVVHRMAPFTIRLRDRCLADSALQPVRVALAPGSRTTGIAVVRETDAGARAVLALLALQHRGAVIRDRLAARRAHRRFRRSRLRYRAPRFDNRTRPAGWLAPSLQHRVDTTMAWVRRLSRLAPMTAISTMLHRFDTQALQHPGISGIEYQRGELFGYEVREYLLETWGRCCAYCDARNLPLTIDHIQPRSRGGSDRVSNLAIACIPCNQRKGALAIEAFLAGDPRRLDSIKARARAPLNDAAAVNSTRWALFGRLKATGIGVEVGTGGRTKWNRARLGIPKTHALDAACAGAVEALLAWRRPVLCIQATGRGSYQRTNLDRFGFPRGYLARQKQVRGFQTGDRVRALVPSGKNAGVHVGRVAVRATGSFNVRTPQGVVQGIHARHCTLIQRADGYGYRHQPKIATDTQEDAGLAASRRALSLPGMNAGASRANG